MPRLEQNDGWEARADELAQPENFYVVIVIEPPTYARLSPEERERMEKKTEMVVAAAKRQMANQLKGTLKYSHDVRPSSVWLREMLDELDDMVNYGGYLREAIAREKEETDA